MTHGGPPGQDESRAEKQISFFSPFSETGNRKGFVAILGVAVLALVVLGLSTRQEVLPSKSGMDYGLDYRTQVSDFWLSLDGSRMVVAGTYSSVVLASCPVNLSNCAPLTAGTRTMIKGMEFPVSIEEMGKLTCFRHQLSKEDLGCIPWRPSSAWYGFVWLNGRIAVFPESEDFRQTGFVVWDLSDGKRVGRVQLSSRICDDTGGCSLPVAASSDGKTLIALSERAVQVLRVTEASRWSAPGTRLPLPAQVDGMAVAPDGKTLWFLSEVSLAKMSLQDGKVTFLAGKVVSLERHSSKFRLPKFHFDSTGQLRFVLRGKALHAVKQDRVVLVSGGIYAVSDRCHYAVRTGASGLLEIVDLSSPSFAVAWQQDSGWLRQLLRGQRTLDIVRARFSPDAKTLYVLDKGTIRTWNFRTDGDFVSI